MAKTKPESKRPLEGLTCLLVGVVGGPTDAVLVEVEVADGEVVAVRRSQADVRPVALRSAAIALGAPPRGWQFKEEQS